METELHTCWGQVCPFTGSSGRWFLSGKVSKSQGGHKEGARGKTTCGKTPVRNEERCSAEVATVAVVGGAEWTNGAVMSRDNYTEGFIFPLLARATAKLR